MGAADIEGMVKALKTAGIDQELIEKITYCVDYEHTVTALEARLRGGYQFQEIITDTLTTTMNFYDADSALVVSVDPDLMIAKPEFETHREGFLPVCDTGPMDLKEYPEILTAIRTVSRGNLAIPYTDVSRLLEEGSKESQRMEQIGIQSIMAVPYNKRNAGFAVVINPRNYTKYPEHNSLLQVLSYVSVAEINEMNLMNCQKGSYSEEGELAPNDVYVNLLNGFELHTNEGTLREKDIRSSQSVLFLTHLMLKKGSPVTQNEMADALWDKEHMPDEPEHRLRNISSNTKGKIIQIFPSINPFVNEKTAFSFNRRYNIITDLDMFGYRIRDIQGMPADEKRVDAYLELLSGFNGIVLPNVDHRSLERVDKLYEEKRKIAQLECISYMYDLGLYVRMHDFICNISLGRNLTSSLAYWDIKAVIGMRRLDMAFRLLEENDSIL
ncbi:MAG: hypothetical protein LUC90_04465 [Lachnospiraceae bacterium]|nr:hypothetical protein [Lachnospiraceae bacterium]